MNLLAAAKVAYRSLRANKLRSGLTMLGMIIGVAAVIAMVAVGAGANERIAAQIASIGSNLIMILPGSTTSGGLRSGFGGAPTLTMNDAKAIGKELSAVRYASPTIRSTGPVVYGNQNWSTIIQGVAPEFFGIREWGVTDGRIFGTEDVDASTKVALLGQTVSQNLFGGESPVGMIVRIKKVPFTVVGVLEPKGQSPQGQDQDDVVYVPITTAQKKLVGSSRIGTVGVILVQAVDADSIQLAEQQVRDLLRQRHRINRGQEEDFSVRNLSEMLAVAEASTRVMSLLLGAIASVSLLVGGIGIMNIMLVTVTERTREIGIRKAIGARDAHILLQFLVESVIMSGLGGLIGLGVGSGAALLIAKYSPLSTVLDPASALLSMGVAAGVGIFFGFYPAWRASRLDPIQALRYE